MSLISPDFLNNLQHMCQRYGLSPVSTLMCMFNSSDWLNALSHTRHLFVQSVCRVYFHHVSVQTVRLSKGPLTHATSVRVVACVRVDCHMSLQTSRLTERPVTPLAFERFVSRVYGHVFLQTTRLTKRLVTHLAFERSVSRVYGHVLLQTSGLTKRLVTQLAFERFVSCVYSHVHAQSTRITICLVAQQAFVWSAFHVGSHVSIYMTGPTKQQTFVQSVSGVNSAVWNKISNACELFAANSTFKQLLSRMT